MVLPCAASSQRWAKDTLSPRPIPENDAWWGKGFTEWTNVTKAVPGFVGHDQPKLPGELGFYDLRVVDTLRRQAELAKFYGIAAFCFHFYWFDGKRLLELPVQNFLANRDIDIQFCFCWANENWTRRWDGADQHVLIGQTHSPEDDVAFIRYLGRYFDDPRYLKIGGKPVLSVYRPGILPDAAATTARWRAEATKMGLPGLYLVATTAFAFVDHESLGFDALSEFPPHRARKINYRRRFDLDYLAERYPAKVFDYQDFIRSKAAEAPGKANVWPGVMPAWDNCARKPQDGHVYHGSTPRLFYEWLTSSIERARANPAAERFVVINAWNEWAEGAYLEPDRRSGYAYLTACASAISDQGSRPEELRSRSSNGRIIHTAE